MLIIQICVGSSCHLKGAPRLVELLEQKVKDERLEDEIVLTGCFCAGKCNRVGVTVSVNDDVYTGITPEGFNEFWAGVILPAIKKDKGE